MACVVAAQTVHLFAWLLTAWAGLQGALVVAGGRDRWAQPQYAEAMGVPGGPYTFGGALLVGAATSAAGLLLARRPLLVAGQATAGIVNGALGWAIMQAWLQHPAVPIASAANWWMLGMLHLAVAVSYRDRDGAVEAANARRVRAWLTRNRGRAAPW